MDITLGATLVCTLLAYLFCGIPFGLVIAKASSAHVDVRKVGSGNIGMTNVARSAGAGAAALTFLCDAGKGALFVLLSRLVFAHAFLGGSWGLSDPTAEYGWCVALVFAGCVLGHVFSPYLGLKGGKGISTGFGAALAVWPPLGLVALGVFLLFAVPSHYVSLGSVCAALSLPIAALVFGFNPAATALVVVVAIVVIWKHRENVKRLIHGEERRFSVHKKDASK